MKAGNIVVKPLITVGPHDFARHAEGLMDDFGLTMLPVTDQNGFRGVLTKAACRQGKPGVDVPRVADLISQPELTAGLGMDVRDLYDAMTVFDVPAVPVLEDGQVVSMLARRDVRQAISRDNSHPPP
jgi:CBS domain-containing protein